MTPIERDLVTALEAVISRGQIANLETDRTDIPLKTLIGFPKDTFDLAEKRLQQMISIGFTPMAMLWQPETPAAEKHRPAPEWRAFQRRWARPAIIHAAQEGSERS